MPEKYPLIATNNAQCFILFAKIWQKEWAFNSKHLKANEYRGSVSLPVAFIKARY
jgi:hypothetical protein